MRQVNLSGIDLDLLPVLDALLRRRNVTQAGIDVGLSQPAVSRALGRLRALFDDPLLVRAPGGLVLTPRAERLAPEVTAVLTAVRGLFRSDDFDPAAIRRTLRLAAADVQILLLLPALQARLVREAPGVDLRVENYQPQLIPRMQRGELDFTFALATTPLPPGAVSEPLGQDDLVLVHRRGHPLAGRAWQAGDYSRVDHVAISLFGDGQSDLDAALAAQGISRRIAVAVPHFISALAIVAQTDLITTISGAFARRFAPLFDLVWCPAPILTDPLILTLVWNQMRSADPVCRWFRDLVRQVAADIYTPAL